MLDLEASEKLNIVFNLIKDNPGITMKDIRLKSGIVRRTLHSKIKTLLTLDLIVRKPCLRDTRQSKFFINPNNFH